MQYFYDGQIRRYVTQMVRLLSNFEYSDGKGNLTKIPVTYGDLTRQVAGIIRDNSENKIPSAPRIAIHINNLAMDRDRTADASYVSKLHIRERAYDENSEEYLDYQGKNYTVERLMPTPYTLTINADIWSTNTEQKLQILEQILTLFNPSLEIQTTDNFVDWTSLTVVNLEDVTFSNRSIPVGVDSEIDIATLQFTTPIYISPPVKVKKLGVVTNIIASIFNEDTGEIDLGLSMPDVIAYDDSVKSGKVRNDFGGVIAQTNYATQVEATNYQNYGVYIDGDTAQIIDKNVVGNIDWRGVLDAHPGSYNAGVSTIYLTQIDTGNQIVGTFSLNLVDPTKLSINWDTDTYPDNTVIEGKTTVDYIIDPTNYNPSNIKSNGLRLLLLDNIGSTENTDGPDAWKNADGSDFVAGANDIVEWNGNSWRIVFDSSENNIDDSAYTPIYTTNINTSTQYRWNGNEWLLSVDGDYPRGSWRISLS